MIEFIKEKYELLKNIFLYGVFGVTAAVVDIGIFNILTHHFMLHELISNIISMHVGMIVSFTLNTILNFKKTDGIGKRFLSYYIIILCGMAISTGLLWFGLRLTDNKMLVKIVVTFIVAAMQFVFNKLFTFKE